MAKINALPGFAGGSDAVAHVSKSGTSQKIQVSQLVDALGHILSTGDIVIRPKKTYADALICNGQTYHSNAYPQLAAKLGGGEAFNVPNIQINASNISYYIKT
ncbi:tail fiber protein [Pseudomonas sp. BP01]|uniref:tail fiber protein n=1 Tax=Pseudomonas sp. BP01 TaxID=2976152 RepID=UPI001FAAD21E|nr:tail fiber protein [Pseudomonas sp. BP01]